MWIWGAYRLYPCQECVHGRTEADGVNLQLWMSSLVLVRFENKAWLSGQNEDFTFLPPDCQWLVPVRELICPYGDRRGSEKRPGRACGRPHLVCQSWKLTRSLTYLRANSLWEKEMDPLWSFNVKRQALADWIRYFSSRRMSWGFVGLGRQWHLT